MSLCGQDNVLPDCFLSSAYEGKASEPLHSSSVFQKCSRTCSPTAPQVASYLTHGTEGQKYPLGHLGFLLVNATLSSYLEEAFPFRYYNCQTQVLLIFLSQVIL